MKLSGTVYRWFQSAFVLAVMFLLSSVVATADSMARIVRLSVVEGQNVQLDLNNGDGFSPAYANEPLAEGMRLSVGEDSRAEVQFEDGSTIRLMANSLISFPELRLRDEGHRSTLVDVRDGLIYFHVLHLQREEVFRVTFNRFQIDINNETSFRIDGDENELHVAVRKGVVDFLKANADHTDIRKNETLSYDMADPDRAYLSPEVASLTDDQWDKDRDDAIAQAAAAANFHQYSQNYSYGFSDLNAYGSYYSDPTYGWLWRPYDVGYDWDPYCAGYWVFYPGRGYVWVSAYSWGWTPYRYGKWIYVIGRGWYWQYQPNYYLTVVYTPTYINPPTRYIPVEPPSHRKRMSGGGDGKVETVIIVNRNPNDRGNPFNRGGGSRIPQDNGGRGVVTGGGSVGVGHDGDTRMRKDVPTTGTGGTGTVGTGVTTTGGSNGSRITRDTGIPTSGGTSGGVSTGRGTGSGTPSLEGDARRSKVPESGDVPVSTGSGLGTSRTGRGTLSTPGTTGNGQPINGSEGDAHRVDRPQMPSATGGESGGGQPASGRSERLSRGTPVTGDAPARVEVPVERQPANREDQPQQHVDSNTGTPAESRVPHDSGQPRVERPTQPAVPASQHMSSPAPAPSAPAAPRASSPAPAPAAPASSAPRSAPPPAPAPAPAPTKPPGL